MAAIDLNYKSLINNILYWGYDYTDKSRNVVCKQISNYVIQHNLRSSFPAITLKKLYWKGIVAELLWFLRGETNIKYLIDNDVNIWNKDAYNYYLKEYNKQYPNSPQNAFDLTEFVSQIKEDRLDQLEGFKLGDLGPVYGKQWRNFNGVDQFSNLISNLKSNPMSRRHIVNAWNPSKLNEMALPPCHWSFEIIPEPIYNSSFTGTIIYGFTLKWHQRSVDTFLGLPFNIASYALLAHIIGKLTGMTPLYLIGDLSNVHLYQPHVEKAKELSNLNTHKYDNCKISINSNVDIHTKLEDLQISDFNLINYKSYPSISADMIAPII